MSILEKPLNPEYYNEYVVYGLHTLVWVILLPVTIPLAIIGYLTYRFNDKLAEKAVEHERKQRN